MMRLPDFILANIEAILDDRERYAMQIPAAQELSKDALRDHAREMLETIVRDLGTPQTLDEQKRKSEGAGPGKGNGGQGESAAQKHATVRMKAGSPSRTWCPNFAPCAPPCCGTPRRQPKPNTAPTSTT